MTNRQYHRRRRALERFAMYGLDDPEYAFRKGVERARLTELVAAYRDGGLRCINGKFKRHPSGAAA